MALNLKSGFLYKSNKSSIKKQKMKMIILMIFFTKILFKFVFGIFSYIPIKRIFISIAHFCEQN